MTEVLMAAITAFCINNMPNQNAIDYCKKAMPGCIEHKMEGDWDKLEESIIWCEEIII